MAERSQSWHPARVGSFGMKDLVILVADKDLEFALKGLLARPEALGIRPVEKDIFIEPEHDPACALRGVDFLAKFSDQYRYGLLMFDHEGSGKEATPTQELQGGLNAEFDSSAWGSGRARAIVLSPELETWIWSDSPHIEEVTGWRNRHPGLRHWLIWQDYLHGDEIKPSRPKEAFQAALREAKKPRSASLYEQIASMVSLSRCADTAFLELRRILSNWFPSRDRDLRE